MIGTLGRAVRGRMTATAGRVSSSAIGQSAVTRGKGVAQAAGRRVRGLEDRASARIGVSNFRDSDIRYTGRTARKRSTSVGSSSGAGSYSVGSRRGTAGASSASSMRGKTKAYRQGAGLVPTKDELRGRIGGFIAPSGPSKRGAIASTAYKNRSKLTAAGVGAVGAGAFVSGIDSGNQVSNSVYNLAFGSEDFDKTVMGRKMGLRSLMAPLPGETFMRQGLPGAIRYPQTFQNARRQSRMSTPKVDGSIAFGMYNSRLG